MISLIHNPRCSKSRQALEILTSYALVHGIPLALIDYQQQPLDMTALKTLQRQLNLPAIDMLRSGESVLQDKGIDVAQLSEPELLTLIAKLPILLQRPIVIQNDRAVIARPPELLTDWLPTSAAG